MNHGVTEGTEKRFGDGIYRIYWIDFVNPVDPVDPVVSSSLLTFAASLPLSEEEA